MQSQKPAGAESESERKMTKRMTEGRKLQWCGDVNVTYMVHVWAQKSRQQSKRSERVKNKEEKPRLT